MALLTPELLDRLRTPQGRELLARAESLAEDPFAAEKLRTIAPPELAAAAVEQIGLRRRAESRFSRASEMWFAAGLLEQASGELIARHRAARFAPWKDDSRGVADLCCGLGGDSACLAEVAPVTAVDRDPLATALAEANAEQLGLSDRITVHNRELPSGCPPAAAAWADPGRREGGRRTRRVDEVSPTLLELVGLRTQIPALGVKLSPATDHAELDASLAGEAHEREAISVRGECRELVLWAGDLAGHAPRRATLLPSGASLAGTPAPLPAAGTGGGWLVEPDAAVLRAGLVGNLAQLLGGWAFDPRLSYILVNSAVQTPFGVTYRVDPPEPFSGRALSARLRGLGAGDVVLKTRGSAVEPEQLRRQLRGVLKHGDPACCPVVLITRLGSRAVMILGERCSAGAERNQRDDG